MLARSGLTLPPWTVPTSLTIRCPSSSTPAFSHFWMRRTTRRSATRCSMNRTSHSCSNVSKKLRFVNRVQDRDDGTLDDFVFQRGNAERPLPPVRLRDVRATYRLCSIRPSLQPLREVLEICLQGRPVVLPRLAVDAGCRVPLHCEVGRAQSLHVVHMMEKRAEPLFPVLLGCLPYTLERAGRAGSALCPGRVAFRRVPLGPLPSLPHLRHPFRDVVRRVPRYYEAVR